MAGSRINQITSARAVLHRMYEATKERQNLAPGFSGLYLEEFEKEDLIMMIHVINDSLIEAQEAAKQTESKIEFQFGTMLKNKT